MQLFKAVARVLQAVTALMLHAFVGMPLRARVHCRLSKQIILVGS